MTWLSKTRIKHLMTENEDAESVRASMRDIHAVIANDSAWLAFNRRILARFLTIPDGDEIVRPVDYANKLIGAMYDYADENRIWIN
jgi:hypothetical protein